MTEPTESGPAFRLTLRALLVFGSGGALAGTAVASHDAVPLFLAVPLLLAPLAALLRSTEDVPPVRLTWASEGTRGSVTLRGCFRGTAGRAGRGLVPLFHRPAPFLDASPPRVWTSEAGIEFELAWETPHPCLATVARPELVWRDPFGLVERSVPVEGEALRVQLFPPELTRVAHAPLRRTTPLPGEIRSRQLGSGGEFFALRPSVPGDTLRQVNWGASARAGRLMANDFRVERTGDLLIVVDLRPTAYGPQIDAEIAAVGCAAAYGLADAFLTQKARVGLALFTEFVTPIPLGSGRRQRFRLLRALQSATVGTEAGPPERLAVSLRRYFPPGVTTVVISGLADDDAALVLPHLRRRGFPAFVLSPSPVPLLAPAEGTGTADDLRAMRLLRLARRQRISAAWEEGPVVDWDDYWTLAPLVRFFSRPPDRRSSA